MDPSLESKFAGLPNTAGETAAQVDGNGRSSKAVGHDKNFAADASQKAPSDTETSNAKLAELASRIQDQESQLINRELEIKELLTERDFLVGRLRETEFVTEREEARIHQPMERREIEFADLSLRPQKRDGFAGTRDLVLSRQEADLRTSLQSLQLRLRELEAKLANRERELKQKETLIDAAAVREIEIARFIERLSSECEKLSAELCEKRLLIARMQDKPRHSTNGGKVWKKVLGLAQEEVS